MTMTSESLYMIRDKVFEYLGPMIGDLDGKTILAVDLLDFRYPNLGNVADHFCYRRRMWADCGSF